MLDALTIAGMVGNVASVVGVVIMNKYIVSVDNFNYMVFLSFMHLVFTYLGCAVLLKLGVFTYKPATVKQVLPLAMVGPHVVNPTHIQAWTVMLAPSHAAVTNAAL